MNMTVNEEPELTKWKGFLDKLKYPKSKVTIGLIGKYIELQDAYKSIWNHSFMQALSTNVRYR
jgi:CTP synthase